MKSNFRALTGLRFFAAMAVVFFHYAVQVNGFNRLPLWMQRLVHCGPISLCFFFVLSGFVLAKSHRDRGVASTAGAKFFWLTRLARLYPIYLLAFVLFAPMAVQKYLLHPAPLSPAVAHKTFVAGAVLYPLMLQSWTRFSQTWNGPAWSLSVEAFFYFFFPFLVLKIIRMGSATIFLVLGVVWSFSLLIVIAKVVGLISTAFYLAHVVYNPLFWTPLFLIGIAVVRFVDTWQTFRPMIAESIAVTLSLTLIIICALCPDHYGDLLISVGLAPLFAAIILVYTNNGSCLVRLLGSEPIYRLGEVSYIIYILQSPLWHYFIALRHGHPTGRLVEGVSPTFFVLFLMLLVAASLLLSRYLEKPMYRWLSGKVNASDLRINPKAAHL